MLCNEDFITTWSLQSNTTPNSKNVWNNVGGKESEDAIIFTDRSDSGVTSPHSHHHIDDRINVISPCDLNLLDHMTNEDLRRRLNQIIKKPNIDEDDKICLQQVLAFVQNLDAMSHGHDSLPSSEESSSLEYIKSRVSDYSSSSRSSDISPTLQLQKPKSVPSQGRIVATVLPYSSAVSTPNDSPQRKLRAWHTTSLTESGVFEGDLSETSVYTQTEPEEFFNQTETTEAQKLIRIREQFEECAKKSAFAKVPVTSSQSLSPNFSDQKRLQYYKDRLEVLEGKLLIYESSGDIQAKRLADRLQREIILENLVKELQDRVDFLEVENSEIEEEKCEFEEAENDTRLRLQRLEVELEILSQRNIELEMSREALQNKLKDCRSESAILRDDLSAVQTQVCHLEEDRCRFKENFEFLHSVLPALVLFNAFCVANHKMGNCIEREMSQPDVTLHNEVDRMSSCDCGEAEDTQRREISNLRGEIRSLKRQINDLNSRHSEAMACADGCWEDLEKSYNDRLMASKSKEGSLQKKIKQLEDCLQDDSRAANEKICQLEDAERELRMCLQKVTRDQRKTLQEHGLITEEYHRLKDKYEKLVEQVDGPIKDALEREKTQNKNLKDELGYIRRINCEQDMHYRNELDCFQVQLDKLQKELLQIQVTNSELKEEVCTLEKEVVSLHQAKKEDLDKIRCLSDEVRTKEEMCDVLEKRVEKLLCGSYYRQRQAQAVDRQMSASFSGAVSLAQELNGSPVKRLKIEEPVDLKTATKNLGTVLGNMKGTARQIPSHRQFQNVANDVKKLAESILSKKSEVSQAAKTPRNEVFKEENSSPSNGHLEESDFKKPKSHLIFFAEPIFHELPSVDLDEKEYKIISEVPSLLRKLSPSQKQRKPKRYKIPRSGFRKRFSRSLRSEIWKVISKMKTVENEEICQIDTDESFKKPNSQSLSSSSVVSFYSVIEESDEEIFFEPINDLVSSVSNEQWSDMQVEEESEMLMNITNFLTPTTSEGTQTDIKTENTEEPIENSYQNFNTTKSLIEGLSVSAQNSNNQIENVIKIKNYLQQRFENDSKFRKDFEAMVQVAFVESEIEDEQMLLSYEEVVRAMTFLIKLEEIYNRSRTTQNDRYRDHTNLSHEPNIEAPAGPRPQPAGQRQTHQAKDKHDENDNGSNTNKERISVGNYFTPRGSFLCSNVPQDGFCNLSSEAGSSIVKLSFSTNTSADLQGSYECFCEEEEGSCHKFWCQRYEVLKNRNKTLAGSIRAFESQNKPIERKEYKETRTAHTACCSQKTAYECLCVSKSLIVGSCTENIKNNDIESQELNNSTKIGPEDNTSARVNDDFQNLLVKENQLEEHTSEMVQKYKDSSKYLDRNPKSVISNATNDLCQCDDFENSTGPSIELPGSIYLNESKSHGEKLSERPNLNESFRSVGTAITPRQSMDENVIPLLKSIFDVLQTMREEKLNLGPIASKNIDIHLDEPFNGLPTLPPRVPRISPKFPKELLEVPCDSRNVLKFEEETDQDYNLTILEPPERDMDDFEEGTSTKSQRLISVDMDLLRTDEELIWEPYSNFDKPEFEEGRSNRLQLEDPIPLKAKFLQFPEETRSQDLHNTEKADNTSQISSLNQSSAMEVESCECFCGEQENSGEDFYRKPSKTKNSSDEKTNTTTLEIPSLRNLKFDQEDENQQKSLKIEVSQGVQVNLLSLQNLNSHSAQFLKFDSQLEGISEEKLLKTSDINNFKETIVPIVNPHNNTFNLDVGTDCPDFDNDDRNSVKSFDGTQEPIKPQNQEMSQFIESILFDLKAMNSFRKNNSHWQSFARLPCPITGGWQRPSRDLSYPVTIERVQELGANSLFVKWRVQNIGNIGGYEIFLDGHLTNRYFNCIHRAAVICDVDLHCPHRITLRAQPLLLPPLRTSLMATDSYSSSTSHTKCPSNTTTHPEASCPQPDGSVWYPSVYHFEPNSFSAPIDAVLY